MWLWWELRDGKESAFQEFASDFGPKLERDLNRRGFSEADASQVAWDATVEVLLRCKRFKPEEPVHQKFLAWAWRVARNYALQWRRENNPSAMLSFDDVPEVSTAVDPAEFGSLEKLGEAEEKAEALERDLRALIAELPPKLYETVRLKVFNGQATFSQVAEILGITEGAAKVRYHRAIRLLRKTMDVAGNK